jgi:hypothetical protein
MLAELRAFGLDLCAVARPRSSVWAPLRSVTKKFLDTPPIGVCRRRSDCSPFAAGVAGGGAVSYRSCPAGQCGRTAGRGADTPLRKIRNVRNAATHRGGPGRTLRRCACGGKFRGVAAPRNRPLVADCTSAARTALCRLLNHVACSTRLPVFDASSSRYRTGASQRTSRPSADLISNEPQVAHAMSH